MAIDSGRVLRRFLSCGGGRCLSLSRALRITPADDERGGERRERAHARDRGVREQPVERAAQVDIEEVGVEDAEEERDRDDARDGVQHEEVTPAEHTSGLGSCGVELVRRGQLGHGGAQYRETRGVVQGQRRNKRLRRLLFGLLRERASIESISRFASGWAGSISSTRWRSRAKPASSPSRRRSIAR